MVWYQPETLGAVSWRSIRIRRAGLMPRRRNSLRTSAFGFCGQ